jgi:hypothetical protein
MAGKHVGFSTILLGCLIHVTQAQGAHQTHNSLSSFLAASSGISLQFIDFEGSFTTPVSFAAVNSTTLPGVIPAGINFTGPPTTQSIDIVLDSIGASNVLFSNFNNDVLRVDFNPGVTAAGSDLRALTGTSPINVAVTIRDPNDVVHTFPVTVPAGQFAFFGITVDSGEIVRIEYNSGGDFEVVDNYLFGTFTNLAPVADCGSGSITVEATSSAGASVQLDGTDSFDPDGDAISFLWDVSDLAVVLDDPTSATPSGVFPLGITMATLTVSDGNGGFSTCDVIVTVQDTTPPEVAATTDVAMLWPPNHKMRSVTIFIVGTDVVTDTADIEVISATIRSDEPDDGDADGNTTGDVHGQDGFASPVNVTAELAFDAGAGENGAWVVSVQLRSERQGGGDGRSYIVDVVARDTSSVEGTTSCVIVVPHDRGH